ncbi:hypothetical protein [Dyadobacter sp. CY312]|uniref:hypothetical protein n=1 Tax=Dyadobacter sp. CY312 TaxID=2907303 RepID=UPI001F19C618|nr:hypothetical protein [Dyadobacter sp. CY312]MCE7042012.1 hypothetical protein [Dyadobacter sp. CY312]
MSQIPHTIADHETIVRIIFSPINVKFLKDGSRQILPNAFRSPADIDEVSVIRLAYSTADFCKNLGKSNEKPSEKRRYFGLASITAEQVRSIQADIVSTPKRQNPAHADIKIGFIPKKGEPLPTEYRIKIDELAKRATFYQDPNPESKVWEGQIIR